MEPTKKIKRSPSLTKIKLRKLGTKGEIPGGRGNFSVSFDKSNKRNFVYVSGGNNNETEFPDLYRLELNSLKWTKMPSPLQKPITGHKCVPLVSSRGNDLSSAALISGGWQEKDYNDSLYLLNLKTLEVLESKKSIQGSRNVLKGPKTMKDMRYRIQNDQYKPAGRRDHAFIKLKKSQRIAMVGGWNALEWTPKQVELEIWSLDSGIFFELRLIGDGRE